MTTATMNGLTSLVEAGRVSYADLSHRVSRENSQDYEEAPWWR